MLKPETINFLMNLNSTAINICAIENGYRDANFHQAEFVGITGDLNFCYKVRFKEDGEWQTCQVYLKKHTETGKIQFEF